jgi:hypothetical protein
MNEQQIDDAFIAYGEAMIALRESINKAFILIGFMYAAMLILIIGFAVAA